MKQILLYLSIMFLLVSCDNGNEEDDGTKSPEISHQWDQVPHLPGIERENATSFVIADKFYVGLGRGTKGNKVESLTDFYEYNPTSKTWKQIAEFPGISREFAIGFTLNNKGYVGIGGKFECTSYCNTTDLTDFWEYDPLKDSWKKVATIDIQEYKKWVGSVVTLNNKAYILYDNFVWEFSAVDYSLTKKSRIPEVLTYATSFTLNNKGYFGTGGGNNNILKSFYEYDPAIDKWTKKADFGGVARRGAVGFTLNGKGYIGCGEGIEQKSPGTYTFPVLNDFWEYNPQVDKWNKVTELPSCKLQYGVSGVVQGRVIIGTGRNEYHRNLKDFWIY